MGKYIPPERMTESQIREEVNREFRRWNELDAGGCRDPHWPDGANMNFPSFFVFIVYHKINLFSISLIFFKRKSQQ